MVILYRDMRTYGLMEDYYLEARNQGVLFARFDPERPPEVKNDNGVLSINFLDHVLERPVTTAGGRSDPERRGPGQRYRGTGLAPEDPQERRGLLHRGPRQAAAGGLRLGGHLPLRHGALRPSSSASPSPRPRPRPPGPGPSWRTPARPSAASPPTCRRTAAPPAWCACAPVPTACPRSTGKTSRRSTRPCARVAAPAPRSVRPR